MVCFQNGPFHAELQNTVFYKSIQFLEAFNTQSQHFYSNDFQTEFQALRCLHYLVITTVVKF